MDRISVDFFSESLGKHSSMNVFIPYRRGQKRTRKVFPVVYLLHGYSDDHTIWGRHTRLEKYADQYGLAIVTPDGSTSYYVNSVFGNYDDHIIKDVVGMVEANFPVCTKRSGKAIAGLSMGGFGALSLGLKNPSNFAAISAHSAAVYPHTHLATREIGKLILPSMLQDHNQLKKLAKGLVGKRNCPKVRFDCGSDDFLYEANLDFEAYLKKIKFKHDFTVNEGAHNWDYWEAHIPETLEFLAGILKV